MLRKRGSFIVCGALLFITWNAVLVLLLRGRPLPEEGRGGDVVADVLRMADGFEAELERQKEILLQIESRRSPRDPSGGGAAPAASRPPVLPVLPVLVIACDRVTVRRCLDKLLELRPSPELHPVVVSQDCGHAETAEVIRSYGADVTHLRQPDLSDPPVEPQHGKFQGYYKISRHYRWALNQVFRTLGHSAAIIVEDDLEVAPDFFEYFRALLPVLRSDRSLWCVSAWNDNGREDLVDPGRPDLLYRTDFFPGLGWMLLRELWEELEPEWPAAFWDDWMRQPKQRRGRACVRPEISRTLTFGRRGVSQGQFYDKYLRHTKLNGQFVPFTALDLGYLREDPYRQSFQTRVYAATEVTYEELARGRPRGPGPFRLQYSSSDAFKVLAKNLGVMEDLKSGVPRTGYLGVVSFFYKGRRVFLAPPPGSRQFDPSSS